MVEAASRALVCLLVGALSSCAGDERASVALPTIDACDGRADGVLCDGAEALQCVGGTIHARSSCADAGLACVPQVGCRLCTPDSTVCDGARRSRCAADGSSLVFVEECAAGRSCDELGCLDLCAAAADNRSYLGCEYWPVFTSNRELDPRFTPAVSVGNGNLVAAHVTITKGERTMAELDVAPRSSATVELAFEAALKSASGSAVVRAGAYHLRASVPVTVHQFNPLLFELPGECLLDGPDDGRDDICHSYTNDASLLFPATALQQDVQATGQSRLTFFAVSRTAFWMETSGSSTAPGFIAVVAVGTSPVTVRVRSSARTAPSASDALEPIEALSPGAQLERTLSPGDVLQVLSDTPTSCDGERASYGDRTYCDPGSSYDLTGTEISADGPIQVISGHDCSNVPWNRPACDHLEESMVPLQAWGNTALVGLPQVAAGKDYVLRVISGADDNLVQFDPPVHEPVTLARAQVLELVLGQPVYISGKRPLMVAQYLTGQGGHTAIGDPSLTIVVPVDQYRTHYNFLTPATYPLNYVDIVALDTDTITLDGELVGGFVGVGGSRLGVATVKLAQSGAHEIRGSSSFGFGIELYGLGSYTSYMLPGGLDLTPLPILF